MNYTAHVDLFVRENLPPEFIFETPELQFPQRLNAAEALLVRAVVDGSGERVDDMIVTSGYKVAGPEVGEVLLEHPAVAECGVIGTPDRDRGQIIKAFAVLSPGYVGDEAMIKSLQDFVKQKAAPYKYPRTIEFLDSLPRTETGKLQRYRLKAL